MIYAKTVVFESVNKPMLVNEIPVPTLADEQILIRNEYVTLCRSDINTYCGKRTEKTPTILGHEIVGRISDFGENAPTVDLRGESLKIGDRITWAIYAANPESEMSMKGIPQKSNDLFKYGHEQITALSNLHGGLSQYTILRANTPILKISENVPVEVAAIVNCSVATVAGALRLAGNLNGKHVMISGVGMLGVIACAMSTVMGAKSVFAVDIDSKRIEVAKKFGATNGLLINDDLQLYIHEIYNQCAPFDVVIELSGLPDSMEDTLDYLAIGGTAVWVGATYPARNTQLNAERIIRNIHTIKGLHNYNSDDFLHAVTFIEKHYDKFPFLQLIHTNFSLDEANEAFQYAIKHNPFRVGITL